MTTTKTGITKISEAIPEITPQFNFGQNAYYFLLLFGKAIKASTESSSQSDVVP